MPDLSRWLNPATLPQQAPPDPEQASATGAALEPESLPAPDAANLEPSAPLPYRVPPPPEGLVTLARLELARILERDARPDWRAEHASAARAVAPHFTPPELGERQARKWARWSVAGCRPIADLSLRDLAREVVTLRVWASVGCDGNALPCAAAAEAALRELEARRKRSAA